MTRLLPALLALILLAMPSAALAKEAPGNAPAGNAALDQYIETVPDATGAVLPRSTATKGGSGALTPSARARLERLGSDGRSLAGAIDATAKAPATQQRETVAAAPPGRSPLRAVLDGAADDSGGGMGMLLPAILLASLLGVLGLVVMRRHAAT